MREVYLAAYLAAPLRLCGVDIRWSWRRIGRGGLGGIVEAFEHAFSFSFEGGFLASGVGVRGSVNWVLMLGVYVLTKFLRFPLLLRLRTWGHTNINTMTL